MNNNGKGRGMKREVRRRQVLIALWAMRFGQGREWVRARCISDALHMKKSSHFMGIVADLVRSGDVHVRSYPHRPNQVGYELQVDASVGFNKEYNEEFSAVFNARNSGAFVLRLPEITAGAGNVSQD